MKYRLVWQALILTISASVISGCGNKHEEKQSGRPPVRVKSLTVGSAGVQEFSSYSGTVEEETGTVVSFSTAGTIRTLTVNEGHSVKKGQLIGTLDDGSLRKAYDIAKATLDQAKDAYERMRILHESNSLPDIKWVEVQSKLSQAESAAEIARIALNDAKLYSPVSGTVSEKMVSVGQTVAPGQPVAKLVDIHSVKVSISIPENEIENFREGTAAIITTNAAPEHAYNGVLVEKGVSANPLSRSYPVKYRVGNPDGKLLPGMICDVKVEKAVSSEGIILPLGSVMLSADNRNYVWLDSAGTARRRDVITGTMLPEGVVIESGLRSGDKVIVSGMDKVSQGMKVTSIN